ncbi:uroporphyrinogen decarboxylase [Stella humosa]|uniref:Uroporphyrinogen decarboxylase n=1 Tax=Stella humosa TaxID=94 RepID=A0A3N1LJH3_9PROT|nr:uroporphyrinogen decarboxylase [Stella humosa]ROP90959.1 uroporphyrinogen decarboxylase [Stella humosa]BBK34691.1 uroporphyrinogen decarboxylase [Stella humosa]
MKSTGKPLYDALKGVAQATPPIWFMRQAGRYLPEYRQLRAKAGSFMQLCLDPEKAATVTLQPIDRFGMDGAILFSDILIVPYGLGTDVSFREGEGPVLPKLRPGDGLPVFDPAAFAERTAPIMETVRLVAGRMPGSTTLIGFAGAPWTVATYMVEGGSSRDFSATKRWAYGHPGEFQTLIDRIVEATIAYLRAQLDAGAEALQLFDSWAGVLPPEAFRRWSIEPAARIVEALRQSHPGVPLIGFPRGAGASIVDYAEATGVDAVSLDTAVPLAWARHWMPGVCLQGNLDPQWLVVGDDGMAAEVERIRDAMTGAPFVFNLGHGIVPETPPEHVGRAVAVLRGEGV